MSYKLQLDILSRWVMRNIGYPGNGEHLKPPIEDPLRRGHNRNNLFTKEMRQGPKYSFSHIVNTFCTSEELKTSLKRTKWMPPSAYMSNCQCNNNKWTSVCIPRLLS